MTNKRIHMKKILSIICAAVFAVSLVPCAAAYELPHSYWSINNNYDAAVAGGDYAGTIKYGVQIIDLVSGEPDNEQTRNIIGSRAYDVAFAYAFTGDYENAVKYFNMYIPYGRQLGWDDGVIIAENYVKQLTPSLDVYQSTTAVQKSYGEKNEPRGVLYGQVSEHSGSDESMVLLYLSYGNTGEFDWARVVLNKAKSQNKAVELALNFTDEASTVRSVKSSDSYLSSLYSLLKGYSGVPIYLRIGAEVNIWVNTCSPSEFKSVFRTVADKMRGLSNISIVWSVAHTSKWKSASWPYSAHDFYPGDEYVDWVGVNCYANKYFEGKTWSDAEKFNEVCFKSGYNSDPVLMIKEIVDTYGDRKPIMISECGSAYRTTGSINQNHDEWAAQQLRRMFAFIPMVYPQVKLMAYFNQSMSNEVNKYALDGSSALQSAYNEAVKAPWFIHGDWDASAEQFFKKADGAISTEGSAQLYTYPHLYGSDSITVEYYIDGALTVTASEVPYKADLSGIRGTHDLKVVAKGNNGAQMSREYTITGNAPPEKADDFSDTSGLSSVQKAAVNYVVKEKIMTGYGDSTLGPDRTITRAEFAAMMCRMQGYDTTQKCTFDDAKSHWASEYINACVKAGAINGIGGNKFDPDGNITTEQAAKILTVVAGLASGDEQYPYGYMAIAEENGVLDDVTNSSIGVSLKRIDSAMMIYNAKTDAVRPGNNSPTQRPAQKPTQRPAQKPASWSEWTQSLPSYVNDNDYIIESKTQYSSRSWREIESETRNSSLELIDEITTTGSWSQWQDEPIKESSTREVESRITSTPKRYHYAHYCTGNTGNDATKYRTGNYKFCDEAVYHDLGWFDSPLPYSEDTTADYAYYVNGQKYRCSNTCYRWYEVETSGGVLFQYRSRPVKTKYIYRSYGSWSAYSDTYPSGSDLEVRERTVYRYKER